MKKNNWIVGITDGKPREYKIGNVIFEVVSDFEPTKSENTIKSRFEHSIVSEFVDLTKHLIPNKMTTEYVCSAVGKEE